MGHALSGRIGTKMSNTFGSGEEEQMGEFQGTADQANEGYNMRSENLPGLHGITAGNEECKCMPGSVVEGATARERMMKQGGSAAVGTQASFGAYMREQKAVDRQLVPMLQELEKEMHTYDKALHDLKEKADVAEQRSAEVGARFMQIHEVYGENNCKVLTADSRAHDEEEPACSIQYHEVRDTIRKIESEVPSTCEVGAVQLLGIRNHSISPAVIVGQAIVSQQLCDIARRRAERGVANACWRSRRPGRRRGDQALDCFL